MSSTAIGFLIILMVLITVVWIHFRGGERLLNWPIKILFGILVAIGVALIVGI